VHQNATFRSIGAAASLKQSNELLLQRHMIVLPQHRCCGLIEAAETLLFLFERRVPSAASVLRPH